MNNKPHLIVDCDGVLLDPVLGFVKWILLHFPEFDVVGVLKSKFGFVEGCIKNFWASDSFATIPMIKASKYPIDYLKHHYKIDVITSCGDDKKYVKHVLKTLKIISVKIHLMKFTHFHFPVQKRECIHCMIPKRQRLLMTNFQISLMQMNVI